MRIALVAGDYGGVSRFTGGIGGLYAMLCPALARLGHEVHVLTQADDGEPKRLEREGVAVRTLAVPGPVHVRALAWGVVVDRALAHERPDVVLAAEYTAGAWRLARRRERAPLVTHLHTSVDQVSRLSGWPRRQRLHPANAIQARLERAQARRSDALLAPTQAILDWTRGLWALPPLPSAVVPNAVDVDRVRNLAAGGGPPTGWPEDGPVVLFAGRLEQRKGVAVLAEAMQRVWRAEPHANLVLAGPDDGYRGGWMSEHVRAAAGASAGRVHVLGVLAPEALYPALAAADAVAFPSLWENFSIAALEAMAAGAALAVSDAGGFPEFVRAGEEALLVAPGDADALAAALLRLLGDRELAARLRRGAAAGADRYRVEAVAPAFADALTELGRR